MMQFKTHTTAPPKVLRIFRRSWKRKLAAQRKTFTPRDETNIYFALQEVDALYRALAIREVAAEMRHYLPSDKTHTSEEVINMLLKVADDLHAEWAYTWGDEN